MYRITKIIVAAFMIVTLAACSKVPVGNVGVKVFLLGGEKGVDSVELTPGRYYIGINEELFLFPTFTQNYVWTKDPAEGSQNDESITFQTVEGMNVGADVGISYAVNGEKVSTIFEKYRKGIDEITDIYMRNMVRDAFVKVSSVMKVDDVYGVGKTKMLEAVEDMVRSQVEDIGINVEKIYLIGSLRLPKPVNDALDAKIAATQKAQQRVNEVAEAKAKADKVREKAKGDADAVREDTSAAEDRINRLGSALRKNPKVIEMMAVEKWNGVMSNVLSGGSGGINSMILDSSYSKVKRPAK